MHKIVTVSKNFLVLIRLGTSPCGDGLNLPRLSLPGRMCRVTRGVTEMTESRISHEGGELAT